MHCRNRHDEVYLHLFIVLYYSTHSLLNPIKKLNLKSVKKYKSHCSDKCNLNNVFEKKKKSNSKNSTRYHRF